MAADSSPVYAKGALLGSDKDWYHGELNTVQAQHALSVSGGDCFLVRVSQGDLILSLIHHGQLHHINIKYGPGWYELESGSAQRSFTELEELVSHYSENPIIIDDLNVILGAACIRAGQYFIQWKVKSRNLEVYLTSYCLPYVYNSSRPIKELQKGVLI